MGALLRKRLPIQIRVDVAYKKITEYQQTPITKRNGNLSTPENLVMRYVSVRPSARTLSGVRGKKNSVG